MGISNTDFMLYFSEMNEDDCKEEVMIGKTYQSNYFDKQPEVGLIQFCPAKIDLNNIKYFQTLLKREMIHAFGFSSSTFEYLKTKYKLKNDNKYILSSPLVKSAVQKHYNCDTLEGAFFEDNTIDKDIGNYWEYTLYRGEIMTADIKDTDTVVLSNLTLSLLEDTEWYKVNWKYNEFLNYGYNQGCDMGNMRCTINKNSNEKKKDEKDDDDEKEQEVPVGQYCILNDDSNNKQICIYLYIYYSILYRQYGL